jgi:hypothetical protein
MENVKNFLKIHSQAIALTIGYVLVASLSFGLGRFTVPKIPVAVRQASALPNYTPNISGAQTSNLAGQTCAGKIKGTASLIYHIPGGAFYDKTTRPIRCFATEAEAKAAGFRKSSR